MAFVHGKDSVAVLDSLALTGYLRGFDSGTEVELADVTCMGDEGHRFIPGLETGTISFDGLWDTTATAGSQDATLAAARKAANASVVTLAPNGLTTGNRVQFAAARENNYSAASAVADAVTFASAWTTDGQVDAGVSLKDLASVSATADGTSVDNAAGTTGGAAAVLHVTANTRNGAVTVKVQHSTNDSTWVDLITFASVTASTTTSERATVAGTVNRYLRATWTVAGSTGALTFTVAAARR